MKEQQVAAARVLARVSEGHNLDAELAGWWRGQPPADGTARALVQDLTYGVMRHRGELDVRLAALLNKPAQDAAVHQLLLVGLYQLHHTRAAPHAVVDQAVQACERMASRAGGLVNAVLRASQRRRAELDERVAQSVVARFSFPPWWIEKLCHQYPDHYAAMLEAGNRHPPLTLRINRRRVSREDYLAELAAAGLAAYALQAPADPYAIVLEKPMPVSRLPGFAEGLVSVQDASAQRAAPLLDVHDGMRVLDACAAPGGKTAHMLELADAEVTAIDLDPLRLARIHDNLRRLGLSATVLAADAQQPLQWWDGRPFERVLADVPCSASGITRRHPDIKWLRRKSDITRFAAAQSLLLDGLWQVLAAGGKFLYVTCSVFKEENYEQIARFIGRHADARCLPLPDVFPAELGGQILPDAAHDGFFYALLQKG